MDSGYIFYNEMRMFPEDCVGETDKFGNVIEKFVLKKGWNLVSPAIFLDSNINEEDFIGRMYYFNPVDKSYISIDDNIGDNKKFIIERS